MIQIFDRQIITGTIIIYTLFASVGKKKGNNAIKHANIPRFNRHARIKSEYSPNVAGLPIIKIMIAMAIAAAKIESPTLIIALFI